MSSYRDFAEVYDELILQDIDYEGIADYIEEIFSHQPRKPELVLDLACGTGNLTTVLKKRGYDMIGVDLSEEMLNIAKGKDNDILYLCQDMCEFELYGTVDAIVCMTDSLNYITNLDDLRQVLSLALNYLNPDGVLIFDINSPYKLSNILGQNTFTYDDEDVFYVWENEYSEQEKLCNFYLTFFVREGERYRRFDEVHTERSHSIDELAKILNEVSFNKIEVFDGYSKDKVNTESERIVFVVRV